MNFLKSYFGLFIVIVLSLFSILPLLQSGFFPMHDDTQVARVFEMGKALRDGMFPVRWVPDLGYGYGYPIFNFYAPLAYYVGSLFTLLGFDALIATKIMMGIGILLSGVFMYLLAREFWGELGGVVSGLFYVYAPYHAVDIYVRGDVAEFWAYAFVPLMFLGIYKVFYNSPLRSRFASPRRWRGQVPSGTWRGNDLDSFEVDSVWKWVIVGSLGYAGVILSHNLTAMMVTPFLIIVTLLYCYIAYRNKKLFTIYYLLFTILLGLALSAFYWLPALLEMKYTNVLSQIGGGADFRDHFVCLQQLWESNWGFGGSAQGCIDGLSFKIGKLHILSMFFALLILATYLLTSHPRRNRRSDSSFGSTTLTILSFSKDRGNSTAEIHSNDTYHYSGKKLIGFLSFLGFMISVFLTLKVSKPIWEAVPLMAFFQYPWRFLLLSSFFSSVLAGAIIWFFSAFKSTSEESWLHFVQPATVRGVKKHLGGALRSPQRWITGIGFVTVIFLLIYFNAKLFQPQTILSKTSSDYTNEIALKWTASKISDEFLPPDFKKPKSEEEIAKGLAISPRETPVQKISNTISLAGIVIMVAGIIISVRKRASV